MTPLLLDSGIGIARRIREGRLSSRDAVETHIAQIERVNPIVNAVVRDRFTEARAEADAADRARKKKAFVPGPFHGVPCTVKECFALTGMPNASGLVSRKNIVSERDATVVARVRAAGAIPLGVTNTSEVCMWMESINRVYGRTNNPYDADRIVGGSSGGEAAIIAAAGSPFGVGSDIGGSIRGPAFFNGVFGHKPTGGLVPGTGQVPLASPRASRYLTTGPIARHAEDLMPLLRIMAGPDGQDVGCTPSELGNLKDVELRGMTLLHVEDNGSMSVSGDLRAAQENAVRALEKRGIKVETARFPELKDQFEIWAAMLGAAQDVPFSTLLGDGVPVKAGRELLKWMVGRSDHTAMALLLALTDRVGALFPSLQQRFIDAGNSLRAKLVDRLGTRGIMLYPTYSTPAPKHYVPFGDALRLRFPFAHQGIMNVIELPATQVPLGLNAQGLPLGCQVISTHGNDHLTIAVALELERLFGGWVPPALSRLANVTVTDSTMN